MTNAPETNEETIGKNNMPTRRDISIAVLIVVVTGLFFFPCFIKPQLVAYYGERFDKDLASSIPDAVDRYSIWIVIGAIVFIASFKKMFSTVSKKASFLAVGVFAILLNMLICTRALQFPYCLDDTYIVFRYVYNILHFGRPDFELGVPVHAISSQLHMWILVASAFITRIENLGVLSQSINLTFEIASLLVLFILLRNLFSSIWLAVYGCALHVMWVYNFLGVSHGKESSETIFLLFLFLYAAVSQRKTLYAWSTGLLSLVRPEGVLLIASALVADFRDWISKPIKEINLWAPPLCLVALVYISIWSYYKTVLPQGLLLKSSIYFIEPYTCVKMIVFLITSAFFNLKLDVSGTTAVLALLGIYATIIVVLWRFASLRVYLVALCLVTAAFSAGNALIMYFPWYCAWWVPLPPLMMTALVYRIGELKWNSKILKFLQGLFITGSIVALPFAYTQIKVGNLTLPVQIFYWDQVSERLRIYEDAGRYLNQVAANDKLVGIGELGIMGVVYHGKMFDLQGMVTPEALKLYPVPADKRSPTCVFSLPPDFPRKYNPDRIIFLDSFGRRGLLNDQYFKDHYTLERFWPNETFDSVGVYLYKRNF